MHGKYLAWFSMVHVSGALVVGSPVTQTGLAATTHIGDLVTGFDCATTSRIEQVSSNHYLIHQNRANWFMVQLTNVQNRTIRIDLRNVEPGHWGSVNPVYAHGESLNDPTLYDSFPCRTNMVRAANKSFLPDTSGQSWHFITNTWWTTEKVTNVTALFGNNTVGGTACVTTNHTLCFSHVFTNNLAWVAMRYPYLPSYSDRYFRALNDRIHQDKLDFVRVCEVGRSNEGRPLRVIVFEEANAGNVINKPGLLIYGHEDGTEPDGSWVSQGAIEFLLSRTPEAKQVLQKMTVIAIPILDVDATARSAYKGICETFDYGTKTPETVTYANWFRKWVNEGKRLDLVVDLHNVEGGQVRWHAFTLAGDMNPVRYDMQSCLVEKYLRPLMARDGFGLNKVVGGHDSAMHRLGGFPANYYGAVLLGIELNCQSGPRHMTLSELRGLGRTFCVGTMQFLDSQPGAELLRNVTERRKVRNERVTAYEQMAGSSEDAISFEWGAAVHDTVKGKSKREDDPNSKVR